MNKLYLSRVIRLVILILTCGIMHLSAAVNAQKITISARNMSLQHIFQAIKDQTGYTVSGSVSVIQKTKPVNIEASEMPLEEFLRELFRDQPLHYIVGKKSIILSPKINRIGRANRSDNSATELSGIQQAEAAGQVVDENGQPMAGVTVRLKGTDRAIITDDTGHFRLHNVDENGILVFSYLGYEIREIRAYPQMGVIPMYLSNDALERVDVVYSTGYQTLSRERSAGSYSKPNLEIMLNRTSSTDILQRLEGLVPGLVINNAPTGEPILIRGLTSINASRAPLIVVDGVEVSSSQVSALNMQDVEDITILKDATAASIWGAKAANGVIVITTKKGRLGERLNIDYNGYYAFQGRPDRDYIPKMNSREFIEFNREIFPLYSPHTPWSSVEALSAVPPHLQIQYDQLRGLISQSRADAMLDSLAAISNKDQLNDLFIRDAATLNQTVSISGGGQVHAFYGSINHIGVKNNTPGSANDRFKINLRNDVSFGKRFSAYLVTDLQHTLNESSNISTPGTGLVPYQLFQDPAGNPLIVNHMGSYSESRRLDYQARSRINLDYSPLLEAEYGYTKANALSARMVGGAKINLWKGLDFQGVYGYLITSNTSRAVLDEKAYAVRNEVMTFTQAADVNTQPVYNIPNSGGRLTVNNSLSKNWTVRNQLLFNHDWAQNQLTVLAGQEATSTTPVSTQAIYRGWDDQLQISRPVDYARLAAGITGVVPGGTPALNANNVSGGEGIITRTTSFYANAGYTFARKYTLNTSWRIDQSNLFGFDKSAQNRPVYSIGGKWALGSEAFMETTKWLNRLDVRLTYGITGNAPRPGMASSWDILEADANVNYVDGVGIVVSSPANNKLTWEGTTVYNAGIDFTILSGRLGGSIDGYVKKTQDLIGTLNTSPLTGYASVTGNFGNLENKGIDLSLNSINVTTGRFLWTSGLIVGYNDNEITELALPSITTGAAMISANYLVGFPAFVAHAYDYAGLNAEGDPQIRRADGTITTEPNVALPEDVLYQGTTQPIWAGGFTNNFQYRDFQLGITISYQAGHVSLRDGNTFWFEPTFSNSPHAEFVNRWKVPGDENRTDIPRYAATAAINNARNTSYYFHANSRIFDASFAKIRDITLSYTLPGAAVNKLGAKSVSLRAQISNLMLWKANDHGIDPEFQSYGGRSIRSGQGQFTIGAQISL